ncbi:MAG: methylmalonyl-CoA mutase family protein [Candidatus Methanoperedens sp.]|nr:methylmalonyl-CoA mutase family protein [Candidatus Methanoperedens sp.]
MVFAEEKLKKIGEKARVWESTTLKKVVEKVPESKQAFTTISGIPIKRVYTSTDIAKMDYAEDLGFPGEFPYTRNIYPTGYRGRIWTMRQYAGFGSAEETNARYKFLLSQGQTGLSVAFDLPTQLGYDSDDAKALGEVGKVGVSINSLEDMEILFNGIPLDRVSTSMTVNAPAAILLAMYILIGEKQNVTADKLTGTIQNDIFKEYIARGNFIYPPEPSIRIAADILEYCQEFMPKWNSISISGYHMREAGSNATQELAFTIASGMAYVEAALERGLNIDDFAPCLSFFFNSHNDFFEEISKFRAARRIWARIMKEKYGAKNPASWMLRFHTQTAGSSLTAQQPENNIVRTTIQGLAAVLGGTQSLHTNSMDEAYALPTEKAVRISLRTQQIIAYESGVINTIDPLAGSYFIESLTSELEERAMKYIGTIESLGSGEWKMLSGMIKGIETGYFQREIADASYMYQKEVERKERMVVGVNQFTVDEKRSIETLKIDEAVQKKQIEGLKKLRLKRDARKVEETLEELKKVAQREGNLMYPLLECVKCYSTVGEICNVLRSIYGEYREKPIF